MTFYQFPNPIGAVIGVILAFLLTNETLDYKFNIFIKGCGDDNITIMCIIYLLAGGFSTISSAMVVLNLLLI